MDTSGEYGQWYYVIFWAPGGAALLLLLLSSWGGGRHHKGGLRHAQGGGASARHAGGGPRHHGAKAGGVKDAAGPTAWQQTLAFFGIGRLPAPFVWGGALIGWGLFGFWGTRLWEAALHQAALFVLPSLVTALAGALATVRLMAALGTRLLPQEGSSALSTVDLCGRTGTVIYPVDETRGRVRVYDDFGTLHDLQARVASGDAPVARGRSVLVTDYDASRDRVTVEEV